MGKSPDWSRARRRERITLRGIARVETDRELQRGIVHKINNAKVVPRPERVSKAELRAMAEKAFKDHNRN